MQVPLERCGMFWGGFKSGEMGLGPFYFFLVLVPSLIRKSLGW